MLSIHSSPLGQLGTVHTGGMSIYVKELATALARQGHFIDIYTCADPDEQGDIVLIGKNVRLIHLDRSLQDVTEENTFQSLISEIFNCLEKYVSEKNKEGCEWVWAKG